MNSLDFDNINDLQIYLAENDINFKDLQISIKNKENICESKNNLLNETVKVNLAFLSDNLETISTVGKENILFVENIELAEHDICMPTKINLLNRSIWLNVCNSEGKTTAKLNVVVEGKMLYNIPFELKVTDNKTNLIQIKEDILL